MDDWRTLLNVYASILPMPTIRLPLPGEKQLPPPIPKPAPPPIPKPAELAYDRISNDIQLGEQIVRYKTGVSVYDLYSSAVLIEGMTELVTTILHSLPVFLLMKFTDDDDLNWLEEWTDNLRRQARTATEALENAVTWFNKKNLAEYKAFRDRVARLWNEAIAIEKLNHTWSRLAINMVDHTVAKMDAVIAIVNNTDAWTKQVRALLPRAEEAHAAALSILNAAGR
jgi:transcription elongation GreA/GreB family factor